MVGLSVPAPPGATPDPHDRPLHVPSSRSALRWPEGWAHPWGASPVTSRRALVATTDAYATRVGLDVLEAGGNALDAAVAVSFALAVVNPEAGNLGGSGFLLHRAADGSLSALDYRGRAPAAATPEMFQGSGVAEDASEVGALAVAVPGSVRGLAEAHTRLGSAPWPDLVQPAVALARGFTVTERFTRSFPPHIVQGLRRFPASRAVFLPGGDPPNLGDRMEQTDLATTLERIRDGGPDSFYRGPTADGIVAAIERGGGVLTHDDLAAYEAVWREPVRVDYRGRTIVSMPPSSSGGVTLALIANIVRESDLGALEWHGTPHVHLLAETFRRAFADRNHYLADADVVRGIPLETLLSSGYGAWRAGDIEPGRATPSAVVGPGVEAYHLAGGSGGATTHVSIVGPAGDAVSLTTTLNTWYGSKLVADGTGVLLNNEMDDFTARPGVPNHFGLVQGEANAIAPGKRMLSAMTPTMVLGPDGRLELVVGTPGGSTIITTVFQVISNRIDHGMPLADAVYASRVHHQHLPDMIYVEHGGLEARVVAELARNGHTVAERPEWSGDVMAVGVGADGVLEGVADPRRGGVAGGMPG